MTSLGLEHDVIDRETYRRTVDWFRGAGILLPTFAQLAAPATLPAGLLQSLAAVKPDEADPRNLFRVHWYNDRDRAGQAAIAGARGPAQRAHRRARADRGGPRRPVPDDPGAQGARRLRVPGAPRHHRHVRPGPGPCRLALDRELLPGRGGHLRSAGLPWGGRPARGHEPGAFRLARGLGHRPARTSSARRAPRATSRRSTTSAPSWPPIPATLSSTSSRSSVTTSSTTSARAGPSGPCSTR